MTRNKKQETTNFLQRSQSAASELQETRDSAELDIQLELEQSEQAAADVPKITNLRQAKAVLEALLFATTEPLSLSRLERLMAISQRTIRGLLLQLQMEYHRNSPGLQVLEVAGGYQMATRPECHPWLAKLKLSRAKTQEQLSVPALETLAIIAYKQPISRQEIDTIRGVDSSGLIRKLLELGLIKVVGKKSPPKRAYLYGTTKEFLQLFGLKSIKDLPMLSDLKQLLGIRQK